MYYTYLCRDKRITVYVGLGNVETVTILDNKTGKQFKRSVHKDNKGLFFTWDKFKIYLTDWVRMPISQIKNKIETSGDLTTEEVCQAILSEGLNNVRFIVPMYENEVQFGFLKGTKPTLCKVSESCESNIRMNFLVRFIPVESSNPNLYVDYTTSELVSALKRGDIKIV